MLARPVAPLREAITGPCIRHLRARPAMVGARGGDGTTELIVRAGRCRSRSSSRGRNRPPRTTAPCRFRRRSAAPPSSGPRSRVDPSVGPRPPSPSTCAAAARDRVVPPPSRRRSCCAPAPRPDRSWVPRRNEDRDRQRRAPRATGPRSRPGPDASAGRQRSPPCVGRRRRREAEPHVLPDLVPARVGTRCRLACRELTVEKPPSSARRDPEPRRGVGKVRDVTRCHSGGPPETLAKPLTRVPLVDEGIGSDQEEQAVAPCPTETVRSVIILLDACQNS